MKVQVNLNQESVTLEDVLADLATKMQNKNFRSWTRTFAVKNFTR